jgi:5-methylcytosine-specific restriction endonuclease McrA
MPWAPPRHHAGGSLQRSRDRRRGDPFYKTARWRALRAWHLRRKPLCADPFGLHVARRMHVVATEVHHRLDRATRPDLALEASNMVSLCRPCHSRVTRPLGPGT